MRMTNIVEGEGKDAKWFSLNDLKTVKVNKLSNIFKFKVPQSSIR